MRELFLGLELPLRKHNIAILISSDDVMATETKTMQHVGPHSFNFKKEIER